MHALIWAVSEGLQSDEAHEILKLLLLANPDLNKADCVRIKCYYVTNISNACFASRDYVPWMDYFDRMDTPRYM